MLYKAIPTEFDDWYGSPYYEYIVFIPGEMRIKFTGSVDSAYYIDCRNECIIKDYSLDDCEMMFANADFTRLNFYDEV